MLRILSRLGTVALVAGSLAVVACSKDNPINPNEAAAPGSERDFIVNVGDRIYFPVDITDLQPEAQETLRRQAAWLKQYPNVRIQVEGHADERGTREYNIALSARRGTNTRDYLVKLGIDPGRLSTISYGKERPVAVCDAESCWSQNRRAVTVITGGAASG